MADLTTDAAQDIEQIYKKIQSYSPRPAFDIKVAGESVPKVNKRLVSLTITDNRSFEADTIDIVLEDADGAIQLPPRGTQISVAIGWEGQPLVYKGMYTVDEITHAGPPDRLTISARSVDFRDTFNVKREYSWHNTTVSYVVRAIASRYGLKAGISTDLADIEIDHADQTSESDISFLTRMAEMLGAATTVKNGTLLFITPGSGRSASGKVLPSIKITRQSGDQHNFRIADRDAYTGVTAYWMDLGFGKKRKTTVRGKRKPRKEKSSSKEGNYLEGADGNVYVLRSTFKTEEAAKRAATVKWQQLKRGAAEFSMTLGRGIPELYPELHAEMSGFKSVIDEADWTITKAVHNISGHGFTTELEFEVRLTDWVLSASAE
ncbi:MAG: phage late control D family protein [Ewingella sp.]